MEEFRLTSDIKQNGEKIGWICLHMKLASYQIDVHLFGISVPVETVIISDYFLALHKMRILENKYSY